MTTPGRPYGIVFRSMPPKSADRFEVEYQGRIIGLVSPFAMGVGQFGRTWVATTPGGQASTRFRDRDTAAAWLVEQLAS